ncbi:MAG TPA: 2-phospho-L-lactate guanylyltransferase [Candidatus Limnocylindrales bacterium]|nr:2-phospho-L-lactate guanylyltransferase [Candidatus Limnocylindrales bacterium]
MSSDPSPTANPGPAARDDAAAGQPASAAVIPVRSLEGAKTRLGHVLDAEERRDLVARLLRRTVGAARQAGVADIVVVSEDDATRALAAAAGARAIGQRRRGLNAALGVGRDAALDAGAATLVVLPGDLPLVDGESVAALFAAARPPAASDTDSLTDADEAVVVLVPDRHGRGTNALLLRPPDVIAFAFGADSRATHARLAAEAGARYVELESPLSIDLDTPEDLLLVEDRLVELGHAG